MMNRFGKRFAQLATTDFCPWANKYVYWLKRPLGWLVIAAVASLLCGIYVGPQGYAMFAALSTVVVLGIFWPWIGMWGTECTLSFDRQRVREGDAVRVKISVTNRWPWPLWGLTIERGFFAEGESQGGDPMVVSLARVSGWTESDFYWEFVPPRRGLYPAESPLLATGFPFGIFQVRRSVKVESELLVWPRTVSLASIPPMSGRERSIASMVSNQVGDEGDVLGTRPYRHGDSMRNIHWAQTARQRKFVVCERQVTAKQNVRIVIDTNEDIHNGNGSDGSLEWTIRIAASICQTFHAHNCAVEYCLGPERYFAEPGPMGLRRMLDRFARFDPLAFKSIVQKNGNGNGHRAASHTLPFVVTTEAGIPQWNMAREATTNQRMIVLRPGELDESAVLPNERAWISIDQANNIPRQLRQRWEASCQKGWCGER